MSLTLFPRGGADLGGSGRGVRRHVAAGARAHRPGQPLLLQEPRGRGQVAGGGDIQVSHDQSQCREEPFTFQKLD